MEAIILAGGFGTRLKNKLKKIPKPMAPINGKPFLDYLLNYLSKQKINRVILSVYYQYELIKEHYKTRYKGIDLEYSIDEKKLGTGGAIKAALSFSKTDDIFIINGDTFFDIDLDHLYNKHKKNDHDITIALKPMIEFDRYGIIEIDKHDKVIEIKDKQYCDKGLIDGGIYIIKNNIFSKKEKFEFCFNDFLSDYQKSHLVGACVFDKSFIDIGTPEHFKQAQSFFLGAI